MQTISYLHSKESVEWSGLLFFSVVEGSIEEPGKLVLKAEDLYLMDVGTHSYTEYEFSSEMMDVYEKIPQANPMYCDEHSLPYFKMGHIHTHHSMDAFFSGTDTQELKDNAGSHNYYLSLIVNYKREYCAKIAIKSEIEFDKRVYYKGSDGSIKTIDDKSKGEAIMTMDCEIIHEGVEVVEERYKELKAKKTPKVRYGGHYGYSGYDYTGYGYPKTWDNNGTAKNKKYYDCDEHNRSTSKSKDKRYEASDERKEDKQMKLLGSYGKISAHQGEYDQMDIIKYLKKLMGLDTKVTMYAGFQNIAMLNETQYQLAINNIESRILEAIIEMPEKVQETPVTFLEEVIEFLDAQYPRDSVACEISQTIHEYIICEEDVE
jgi:hypothetical protein